MAQTKTTSKTAKKRSPKPPTKKAAKKTTKKAAKKSPKKAAPKKKAAKKKTAKKAARKTAAPAAKQAAGDREVTIDRRRPDRQSAGEESKAAPKLERREKVNRRRQIDPTTCERDYSDHEVEFMNAMDAYKRRSGRMFPTCSEVLEVIRDLGYVRLSAPELANLKDSRGETDEPEDDTSVEESAEAAANEALAQSDEIRVD